MKMKGLFSFLFLVSLATAFCQSNGDDATNIKKFSKKLAEIELFKKIQATQTECVGLVKRVKSANITDRNLIAKYEATKTAFDKVIDAMETDVKNASTISGLVQELVTRKEKRETYKTLADNAGGVYQEFKMSAYRSLSMGMPVGGLLKDMLDWFTDLMPPIVRKITNEALNIVKDLFIKKLETLRFQTWDNI
jgi:thioredoxin-related protein